MDHESEFTFTENDWEVFAQYGFTMLRMHEFEELLRAAAPDEFPDWPETGSVEESARNSLRHFKNHSASREGNSKRSCPRTKKYPTNCWKK